MSFISIDEGNRSLADSFINEAFDLNSDTPLSDYMKVIALVDEKTNQVTGVLAFEIQYDLVEIKNIYVDEEYRNKGFATKLIDELKFLLLENSINTIIYHYSVPFSKDSKYLQEIDGIASFFEKQGFWTQKSIQKDDSDNDMRTAVGIMSL